MAPPELLTPSADDTPDAPRADWAPFDLVFFDCDSTLVSIEGIDEVAQWVGRQADVAALTAQAMNGDLPLVPRQHGTDGRG